MPCPPWPVSDTGSFWRTFLALDDSQETFDILCALVARVVRSAGNTKPVAGTDLRMLKSRRYHFDDRVYLPLRLFFAFETDEITAALLIVEDDDELEELPPTE
jgi:hypothetical protein